MGRPHPWSGGTQPLLKIQPRTPRPYSLAGYQSPTRHKSADAVQTSHGRLLISVLLEFWLTDGDLPLPLPPIPQGSPDLLSAFNTSRSSFSCIQAVLSQNMISVGLRSPAVGSCLPPPGQLRPPDGLHRLQDHLATSLNSGSTVAISWSSVQCAHWLIRIAAVIWCRYPPPFPAFPIVPSGSASGTHPTPCL